MYEFVYLFHSLIINIIFHLICFLYSKTNFHPNPKFVKSFKYFPFTPYFKLYKW